MLTRNDVARSRSRQIRPSAFAVAAVGGEHHEVEADQLERANEDGD